MRRSPPETLRLLLTMPSLLLHLMFITFKYFSVPVNLFKLWFSSSFDTVSSELQNYVSQQRTHIKRKKIYTLEYRRNVYLNLVFDEVHKIKFLFDGIVYFHDSHMNGSSTRYSIYLFKQ